MQSLEYIADWITINWLWISNQPATWLERIHCIKPATHLAILYADRRDRRIKSPISGMSDIGD